MKDQLVEIVKGALEEISAAKTLEDIEGVRVRHTGKKSPLSVLIKSMKERTPEEKKELGPALNDARTEIHGRLEERLQEIEEAFDGAAEWVDVTAPGKKGPSGHLHPLTIVQRDIEDIFTSMGFEIADGPEVETEYYNFDAVNVPDNHPARDMQDTFWIETKSDEDRHVLRTHTSNVQVRAMQEKSDQGIKPPFRIIVPGRVFRQEATDASHEHTFHQFEALVVGEDVSVANFLHIAESFFSQFFGQDMKVRVRPSYFPFVEPGFEFDISCTICGGDGCSSCQQTGWIEVGGAGMVHQNVLEAGGYEKGVYTGFAWGFGLERLAMMKYRIDDIRHFHGGDVRFTRQF